MAPHVAVVGRWCFKLRTTPCPTSTNSEAPSPRKSKIEKKSRRCILYAILNSVRSADKEVEQ